jgi:hypothetical protein
MKNKENKKTPLIISNDSEEIYFTGVIGGASEVDIRILLLQNKVTSNEDGKLVNQDISNHQLVMSPIIAVRLYNELKKQIDVYNSIQADMIGNSKNTNKSESINKT